MAIIEDTDFPCLTPPEEKMPSGSRLFRRAEELTDDQFDLLAAAWDEGSLAGEALAELQSVIAANELRRVRAGSFHSIRLVPLNETWPGISSAIRPSPVLTVFRRTLIPALLAVAAMIVLIIHGPAGAKLKTINSGKLVAETGMTTAEIPVSSPIISVTESPMTREATAAASTVNVAVTGATTDLNPAIAENRIEPAESELIFRVQPLTIARRHIATSAVAPAPDNGMTPINIREIIPSRTIPEEKNWMLRSVSFLASAVTGKEKQIDGYAIASGCITGINTILGWDMELAQVSNKSGEPVAVSFSSSLLSFTKAVNKTTP
ncbi:MAG: hypothetical protein AB9888_02700 [Bacteroidales bacterium]